MARRDQRLSETREDVFSDMISGDIRDPGLSFQEYSRRVSEMRDQLPLDDAGAGLAVVNEADDRRSRDRQRTVETTPDDLFSARRYHQGERSTISRARDEATDAQRVIGDFEEWSERPDELDFPGIDTTEDYGPRF